MFDYIDPYGSISQDRLRVAAYRREAETRRLIAEYRLAHPEQALRNRVARLLRQAANRLSTEPPAASRRTLTIPVVRTGPHHQPSAS